MLINGPKLIFQAPASNGYGPLGNGSSTSIGTVALNPADGIAYAMTASGWIVADPEWQPVNAGNGNTAMNKDTFSFSTFLTEFTDGLTGRGLVTYLLIAIAGAGVGLAIKTKNPWHLLWTLPVTGPFLLPKSFPVLPLIGQNMIDIHTALNSTQGKGNVLIVGAAGAFLMAKYGVLPKLESEVNV